MLLIGRVMFLILISFQFICVVVDVSLLFLSLGYLILLVSFVALCRFVDMHAVDAVRAYVFQHNMLALIASFF